MPETMAAVSGSGHAGLIVQLRGLDVITELKMDRRTQRTRSALMSAFVELLLGRGYGGITVEDIVTCANVGRSTFYMHYAGKEDILKQSLRRPSAHLADIVGSGRSPDLLIPVLGHFREQQKINGMFFAWPVRGVWVESLAELIELRLNALARKTRARPIVPPAMIARQISEAQISLIAHWLAGRISCRPNAIAEALVASTDAIVLALLRGGAPALAK